MAVRVLDAGAGLLVSKENITVDSLSRHSQAILGDASGNFRRSAAALSSLMRLAGGSERGADLIVAYHPPIFSGVAATRLVAARVVGGRKWRCGARLRVDCGCADLGCGGHAIGTNLVI